jgi:hypothetical protein
MNRSSHAVKTTRHVCTKADPWTPEKGDRAQHPDAVCVYDGGWEQEYERYECPNCGHRFAVTLGQ